MSYRSRPREYLKATQKHREGNSMGACYVENVLEDFYSFLIVSKLP